MSKGQTRSIQDEYLDRIRRRKAVDDLKGQVVLLVRGPWRVELNELLATGKAGFVGSGSTRSRNNQPHRVGQRGSGRVHRREEEQGSGHSGLDGLLDEPTPDGRAVAFLLGRDPDEDAITAAFVGHQRDVTGPRGSDPGKPDFDTLKDGD